MKTKAFGLFFGSSTCYTEMAAEKIRDILGQDNVDMFNVADCDIHAMEQYDKLLFGIPTWDYGELQEDWEAIWDDLDKLDFTGRTFAIFGLGDQIGYPQWFLDAMGYLHNKLVNAGALPVGYWPNEGFDFEESQALTDDQTHFLGLALDEENESHLSDARMQAWCKQVREEFDKQ